MSDIQDKADKRFSDTFKSLEKIMNSKVGEAFAPLGVFFLANKRIRKAAIKIDNSISASKNPKRINSDDTFERITRSIEFAPEYYQAGMSILSYFGQIIRKKYTDENIKVTIEQEDLLVRMIIETPDGMKDKVEKVLKEYGLVVRGAMPPENFLDDSIAVLELKNLLRLAKVQIENQREIMELSQGQYVDRIVNLENEISWLRSHIGRFLIFSEKQTDSMTANIKEVLMALDNQNEVIIAALSLLSEKIEKGIVPEDETEIKSALKDIYEENKGAFNGIVDVFNELIVKGAISGVSGNLLYEWIKVFL